MGTRLNCPESFVFLNVAMRLQRPSECNTLDDHANKFAKAVSGKDFDRIDVTFNRYRADADRSSATLASSVPNSKGY